MLSEMYIGSKWFYLGPIQPPFFIHYLIKYRHIFLFIFDGNIAFKPELKRLNDLGWTKLSPSGKVENKEEVEYLRPFAKLTDKG